MEIVLSGYIVTVCVPKVFLIRLLLLLGEQSLPLLLLSQLSCPFLLFYLNGILVDRDWEAKDGGDHCLEVDDPDEGEVGVNTRQGAPHFVE